MHERGSEGSKTCRINLSPKNRRIGRKKSVRLADQKFQSRPSKSNARPKKHQSKHAKGFVCRFLSHFARKRHHEDCQHRPHPLGHISEIQARKTQGVTGKKHVGKKKHLSQQLYLERIAG